SVLLADYVYFENSSSNPYLIRRIEELNKVVCAHVHVVCCVCASPQFHAMDTLHRSVYDVAKAISALVPQGGPVLCRDEMEEWSASEASLFEEALEKYGKDFTDIQQDFLPWKSLTSIIEYYYMWKTTDRYVQQKRLKAAEAESKLKQVYIPN
ncbi:PREDICTED: metastasis-associated protein MTA1, partial [Myotis davidii]|uniref:metastasis-associated protein MTA1 n=1 Tax=Myotis davidii TaxID=225400 RepID=UPI000767CAE9